jgi:hypothetical protein
MRIRNTTAMNHVYVHLPGWSVRQKRRMLTDPVHQRQEAEGDAQRRRDHAGDADDGDQDGHQQVGDRAPHGGEHDRPAERPVGTGDRLHVDPVDLLDAEQPEHEPVGGGHRRRGVSTLTGGTDLR